MTAPAAQAQRLPPRGLVRIFWVLHRAAYRLTGGRFGLWRPKAGGRFGTMRLTTIGRRSGQPRAAIVGYFESFEAKDESLTGLERSRGRPSQPRSDRSATNAR